MTTVDTNILLQFIFNVHNLIKVNLNRKKTNNVFGGGIDDNNKLQNGKDIRKKCDI